MNKTPPARPNLGFTICHLSLFPLGFTDSRVIFILNPRASPFSKCWSNLSDVRRPNQGLCQPDVWLIRCALRTRYVQLLSGFVGTFGRLCWSCFAIVEMSCNRDSEPDREFLGEGISFVDRESLCWAKLGHPCRVWYFQKPCSRLWADGNLLMSGCRELDT